MIIMVKPFLPGYDAPGRGGTSSEVVLRDFFHADGIGGGISSLIIAAIDNGDIGFGIFHSKRFGFGFSQIKRAIAPISVLVIHHTPETYIYGTTAALTASANFDVANKCMTVSTAITSDEARAMTGKLVNVQYTLNSTAYVTPMCIERVDYAAKKVYFRWVPGTAVTDNWKTANTLKIVPYGGGAAGCEVFSTLIYGRDAFGSVSLGGVGHNVSIIINPPGSAGALDPYGQRGTIAWKVKGFCTAILQDDFIVRLESGATA